MKALEKLISDYKRKIEKLEKSSDLDYKNNNMSLSAAKQMTAESLKTAVSDIKRAMAADTGEKQCNLPIVSGSAFVAKADRENILVLVDDKYKVFNKLREIGKTWKSISIEPIDKVV